MSHKLSSKFLVQQEGSQVLLKKKERERKSWKVKLSDLNSYGSIPGQLPKVLLYLERLKGKLHIVGLLEIHIVHEKLPSSHLHEDC